MGTQVKKTELDAFAGLLSKNPVIRQRSSLQIVEKVANDGEKTKVSWLFKRLVRGLGSTKECSRAGFFSTLVTILNITPQTTLSYEEYSEIINKELNQVSSKLDEGLTSLGKILAHGALISSGYVDHLEPHQKQAIVKTMLKCSQLKDYLSPPVFMFLTQLLHRIDQDEYTSILAQDINKMFSANKASTHDKIFFSLLVEEKFGSKSCKQTIGTKKVLSEINIAGITEDLLNKPLANHPIYRKLAEKLVEDIKVGSKFWECVNGHCEKKKRLTANQECFVLGIFQETVNSLKQESLDIVEHMMKGSILKILIHAQNQTKEKLKKCLDGLSTKLQNAPPAYKVLILKQILTYPKGHNFDRATGTRFLFRLTNGLDDASIKDAAKIYYNLVVGKGPSLTQEDLTLTSSDKIQAANVYKKLVSNISIPEEKDWKIKQLKKLIKLGIFQDNKNKVGKDISSALGDIFFNLVMDKYPSINDYTEVLSEVLNFISEEIKKGVHLSKKHDGIEEALNKGINKAEKLKAIKLKNQAWSLPVFRLLILYVTLLLIKEPSTGLDLLNDLFEILERLTKPSNNKGDDPEWSEVLIDMFLLLLSKSSHGNRQVVSSVFKHVYPHMGMSALLQILSVLDPINNDGEEDEDSEEDAESEEDDQDNVEEADGEKEDSDGEAEDNEGDGSEDDSDIEYDDSEEEDPTQTEKLRMALTSALSQAGMSDNESVDIDDMSKEESNKLDDILSEVFRSQLKRKKPPKKLSKHETNKIHFKIRVLDLIEELFTHETTSFCMIEASVINLLELQEYCIKNSKGLGQLLTRTRSCLQKLGNLKKCDLSESDNMDKLSDFFNSVVKKNERVTSIYNEMFEEIIAVSKFILRLSVQIHSKNINKNKIFKSFQEVLNSYYTGEKECVPSNKLFMSVIMMGWQGMYSLMPQIVEYGFSSSVSQYKQCQALELFEAFVFKSRYLLDVPEEYSEVVNLSFKNFNTGILDIPNDDCQKLLNSKKFSIILRLLQKLHKSKHSSHLNMGRIKKILTSLCSTASISNKQNFKDMRTIIQLFQIKATLQKSEPQPKQENGMKKEAGPRKRTQDARKLKKESKKMRLEAMGGLEDCTFSTNLLEMSE